MGAPAPYLIALDVGGSSVKSAVVTGGQLSGAITHTPIDSQGTAAAILGQLARVVAAQRQAARDRALRGAACAFPGPFDYASGVCRIRGVAKFDALYGLNIAHELRARLDLTDLSIRFRNDAEAAIVGEARYGVGRPFRRVVGLTLGTGCGSAFLEDGAPVTEGPDVPPQGWLYPLLFRGCQADDLFSSRGLEAALAAGGVKGSTIPVAAELARTGDASAQAVFTDFGCELGEFLQPWVVRFGADAVMLQGGLTRSFDLFAAPLRELLPTPVLAGQLGAGAALLGVADLFRS